MQAARDCFGDRLDSAIRLSCVGTARSQVDRWLRRGSSRRWRRGDFRRGDDAARRTTKRPADKPFQAGRPASSRSIRRRSRSSTRRPSGSIGPCSTAWTCCAEARSSRPAAASRWKKRSRCATTRRRTNEKILDALWAAWRPPDGTGVDYDATWVRHTSGDLKSSNPLLSSSVTEFEYQ